MVRFLLGSGYLCNNDSTHTSSYLGQLRYSHFGFRKCQLTSYATHHLVGSINNALQIEKIPNAVFIDFKKAFSMLDFELLLRRLRNLGIRSNYLQWFVIFTRKANARCG